MDSIVVTGCNDWIIGKASMSTFLVMSAAPLTWLLMIRHWKIRRKAFFLFRRLQQCNLFARAAIKK